MYLRWMLEIFFNSNAAHSRRNLFFSMLNLNSVELVVCAHFMKLRVSSTVASPFLFFIFFVGKLRALIAFNMLLFFFFTVI